MMTKDEYFKKHIPHRIILLTTFRERFSPLSSIYTDPDIVSDFFCCSKDISMLMVRFLLGELGINLKERQFDICEKGHNQFVKKLLIRDVIKDSKYENVLTVLKAANRAVAHIEENDINHPLQLDEDNQILFDAIDFTEEKIKSNMYHAAGFDYQDVLSMLESKRKRIKIVVEK